MTVAAPFTELVADWEQRPLLRGLGVTVSALEPGHACLAMDRNSTNVSGVRDSINGGVQASVAEVAAHLAIATLLGPGERIEGTQDLGISYLYSARAKLTVIEARVLRHGRLTVVDVEVRVGDEGEDAGRINAKARVTCALSRER
ncbi:MAG: PaaI family thioesterase [Chloroflexi bacterium]|nr:PaaI family thioesterase [Chloroflexota bacterium]MDA1146586.1 PaaI family thioesterase [Chloroflexota bacterium]MQC82724.1 PaaI family thioesterase [Chloroflexota bacterium]